MNHNPWYVDQVASYERQRIRDDMKQIRLEQKAMKANKQDTAAAQPESTTMRALRHATVAVAQAVLGMLS